MNAVITRTAAEESLGLSLPSRRQEEWKWTDLRRLLNTPYTDNVSALPKADVERLIASAPTAGRTSPRVVVVNGKLFRAPEGVAATQTAPAISIEDPLLDLNAKLKPGTISLRFDSNVNATVEVLHVTGGGNAAVASRLHVEVAEGASATLVETFVGEGNYLNNPVTTIMLGKGARLDRIKLERESREAQHLSHLIVHLHETAQLNDVTLTAGAGLSRQNGNIVFAGENANASVGGCYLLNGKQHVDTRLVVDHAVPHCVSRELFKCVMDDSSRGVFQGKVIVRPDAQKTDGKQSSHALLLSETAEFDAKPELEIYADDVVCGHGTTCGDLNHDHLFYLRSRGIPEAQARAMLVEAFVAEAFDNVSDEALREVLAQLVHERMALA